MRKFITISLVTCIVVLTAFVFAYERYTYTEEQVRVDRYSQFSEIPVWNLDDETATEYCRLISRAGGYRSIRIFLENDEPFAAVQDEYRDGPLDGILWNLGLIRDSYFTAPIMYDGRMIGRINVVWVNKNVYVYLAALAMLLLLVKLVHYALNLVKNRRELEQNNQTLHREVTERRRAERALGEEKERLSVTLRSIGDGVITTDMERRVILVNNIAERMTGWSQEEAIGKPIDQVFKIVHEETRDTLESPVDEVLREEQPVSQTENILLVARDGGQSLIENTCTLLRDEESEIIGTVLAFRDISEARQMEEERIRISKLDSIGLLAGGIAHDFNNDLASILGFITLARMEIPPDSEASIQLAKSEEAAAHAKTLTQQLLTFARGGAPVKSVTSLHDFIQDSIQFVLSGSRVSYELTIPEDIWWVDIDKGQIVQVLQNMIINAAQAMPDGGTVQIRCTNVTIGSETVIQGVTLRPSFYVKVSIRDHGIGIPHEHLNNIFDPYFTTKTEGTGLGLATSFTIIKRHGGAITVTSVPNEGTTFDIYLPAASTAGIVLDVKEQVKRIEPGEGEGHILIMDDDPLIRDLFERTLSIFGFSVVCTSTGEEAIQEYQQAFEGEDRFDAVIMDLTIPGGLGGKETLQEIKTLDADVKAIVSSGYSNDPVLADYERYGFCGRIIKPFKAQDLAAAVQQVVTWNGR